MLEIERILSRYNLATGEMAGAQAAKRHLSDLRGCFLDAAAFKAALAAGDPLVYSVAAIAPGEGEGDLHCGLGLLMPGRIGVEYFMTKGHLHAWRPAAEFYIGLSGEGMMQLEDEATGKCRLVPLRPNSAVYVPGNTAHRTINVGPSPLAYLGIYPARAGHDYGAIAARNFHHAVVEKDGQPALVERRKMQTGNFQP